MFKAINIILLYNGQQLSSGLSSCTTIFDVSSSQHDPDQSLSAAYTQINGKPGSEVCVIPLARGKSEIFKLTEPKNTTNPQMHTSVKAEFLRTELQRHLADLDSKLNILLFSRPGLHAKEHF